MNLIAEFWSIFAKVFFLKRFCVRDRNGILLCSFSRNKRPARPAGGYSVEPDPFFFFRKRGHAQINILTNVIKF
jgi:hypothetical protein